jgi:hypothetical protein
MEDYVDSERLQEYLDEKDIADAGETEYLPGIDGLDALSDPVREAGDTAYMLRMYAEYADDLVEEYLDAEDPDEMEETREELQKVVEGPLADLMEEFGEKYREAADEVLAYEEPEEDDETALRELSRYHSSTVETLTGAKAYDDVTETALRELVDRMLEESVDDPIYGRSTEEAVSGVLGEPYTGLDGYDPAATGLGEMDMDAFQEYAGSMYPDAVKEMDDTEGNGAY